MPASCPVSRTELLLCGQGTVLSCPWQENSTTEILATLQSPSLGAGAVQLGVVGPCAWLSGSARAAVLSGCQCGAGPAWPAWHPVYLV